jgi:hypothetical protein
MFCLPDTKLQVQADANQFMVSPSGESLQTFSGLMGPPIELQKVEEGDPGKDVTVQCSRMLGTPPHPPASSGKRRTKNTGLLLWVDLPRVL